MCRDNNRYVCEKDLFKDLVVITKRRCFYCGKFHKTSKLTKDHVFPKSQGWKSLMGNMVPACVKCNVKKGDRMPTVAEVERACALYDKFNGFHFHPQHELEKPLMKEEYRNGRHWTQILKGPVKETQKLISLAERCVLYRSLVAE